MVMVIWAFLLTLTLPWYFLHFLTHLFPFLQYLKFVDKLCTPPNESMDSTDEFSLSTERETKRVRINALDDEESDELVVETEEEWVRIHCRPRRGLFSPHDSQDGPKLSDISKRRESIVCSADGGERRIVDRWGDKEMSEDLLQEWTGSTRFRKSWGVLSEQTQPPAEDDSSPDVKGDILDLRPNSQQGKWWNLRDRKDQRDTLWLIRKKRPKLVIGYGKCTLYCTVLYHEQIRRGAWFLHDLSGDASQLSLSRA